VGTDPFIIGPQGRKVNMFREIVMGLADKFPGKVRCFLYNTGGMGEIIKQTPDGKRHLVRKVERVPIDLMAAIQRGDLRRQNRYEPGRLDTNVIVETEGDLSRWKPERLYTNSEIEDYVQDLVDGRRAYTDRIAAEGLSPEIVKLAEASFDRIAPRRKDRVAIPREVTEPPGLPKLPQPDEMRVGAGGPLSGAGEGRSAWISKWEPRRPPRRLGRWK
jgi:phosphoenolpyruvate carboxykinase (ATP)